MKPRAAHKTIKTIGTVSAGVALVLAGTVAWLLNKPVTGDCGAEAPANPKAQEIRATKVVVQPWLGKHHVFGIFMVPNRYTPNKKYAVTVTVLGFDHNFVLTKAYAKQYVDDFFAEPGHYLLRGYVPTRVALWFLFTGQFGDLRRPCHWSLTFIEPAS